MANYYNGSIFNPAKDSVNIQTHLLNTYTQSNLQVLSLSLSLYIYNVAPNSVFHTESLRKNKTCAICCS